VILSTEQVTRLVDTFVRLGSNGVWEVPQWLCDMQQALGLPQMQSFYVVDWLEHGLRPQAPASPGGLNGN
jgi:hypothetical protein